jgi:hypothetical protein
MKLDNFTRGYIECALWAEVISRDPDEDGYDTSFEQANYDEHDIAPEAIAGIIEECADFQFYNEEDLAKYTEYGDRDLSHAGHDFFLTRNGHGAGFWDLGIDELGDRLTKAAKVYGTQGLYLGDDGLIYTHG